MAARRLLIVMLILLGISTLAAALIPPQSLRENTTASTTTTTTTPKPVPAAPPPTGRSLGFKFKVGGKRIKVVQAEVGDQLRLQIGSKRSDQLEIPAFGLVDTVAPDEPALFDLLVERPGRVGIYFVEARKVAAQIQVRKALAKASKGRGAKPRARGGSGRT